MPYLMPGPEGAFRLSAPSPAETERHQALQAAVRALEARPPLDALPETFMALEASGRLRLDYRRLLNPAQLAAAVHTEGPLLVVAGAGSGKTRTLVHRVAYLLEQGVAPWEILLLTFTRKASREMLDRVEALLGGDQARRVAGGTFHSFALYALKRWGRGAGFEGPFSILDTEDAADTIDLVKTRLGMHKGPQKFPKKNRLQEVFSAARNRGLSLEAVIDDQWTGLRDFLPDLEALFGGYQAYKRAHALLDYDDLLEVLLDLLKTNPGFARKLGEQFRYVMVDEFQDTNQVQAEIADRLAAGHRNLMVVGDDAQSIYAFRGSRYENILEFPAKYPDAALVKIETNYRSTQALLDATNRLMDQARLGYRKRLVSPRAGGPPPEARLFVGQEAEARWITDRILALREDGVALDQIAVLCRADWHNRFLQAELTKRRLPYVVVGGLRFNERAHVKDLVCHLRLLVHPGDPVSWLRVLKLLPGVGAVSAQSLMQTFIERGDWEGPRPEAGRRSAEALDALLGALSRARGLERPGEQVRGLLDYYRPILEAREDDAPTRLLDLEVLAQLALGASGLDAFLEDLALEPPSKANAALTPLIDEGEDPPLTLSTIHSAKGLEWHTVFLPHNLDGLVPSDRALNRLEDLEEERRLFYVACSRAKERLYLTAPDYVDTFNAWFSRPSRFWAELGVEVITAGESQS